MGFMTPSNLSHLVHIHLKIVNALIKLPVALHSTDFILSYLELISRPGSDSSTGMSFVTIPTSILDLYSSYTYDRLVWFLTSAYQVYF